MEVISLRLDEKTNKRIEKDITDFNYGTKTEFIREAIRNSLRENEKERAIRILLENKGTMKGKNKFSDKEFQEWRNKTGSKELDKFLKTTQK